MRSLKSHFKLKKTSKFNIIVSGGSLQTSQWMGSLKPHLPLRVQWKWGINFLMDIFKSVVNLIFLARPRPARGKTWLHYIHCHSIDIFIRHFSWVQLTVISHNNPVTSFHTYSHSQNLPLSVSLHFHHISHHLPPQ